MRISRSLVLSAAVAFVSVGCEVHERDRGVVGVQAEVAVGEPQGPVIEGPGVVAIDVEPDPAQRIYVYDEGYPPGAYIYDNYYYYGGYRYPRDVFVNQFVQANIRQHRYTNVNDNRRQGQQIEQTHRTEFAKTHGVRQKPAGGSAVRPDEQTPVRQPEAPRPNVERPENKAPANEEHRPAVQPPENRTPGKEEHRVNAEHPENKANPPKEEHKPNADEPKKEESK